jgi:hypothetical protein
MGVICAEFNRRRHTIHCYRLERNSDKFRIFIKKRGTKSSEIEKVQKCAMRQKKTNADNPLNMAQNTVRKENTRGYMTGRLYVSKFRGGRFMETHYDTMLEFLNHQWGLGTE